jgi:Protein of unknown function (DUF1214)
MSQDPVLALSHALRDASAQVRAAVDGEGPLEIDRALQFILAAYDLAIEMWFQKGDPAVPRLTNWERPWRKFGGDNPTTTYLSAPVAFGHAYRLRGDVGDAVYAGVQVYTKGPGYNAPSANIADTDLIGPNGNVDLVIGGARPTDGSAWLPLVENDYLVMLRLYHREPTQAAPPFTIARVDGEPMVPMSTAERAAAAEAFFREEVLSTISVTDALRAAGVNAYPPLDAPVHRPRYTGALFPTLDNVYDGFYVDLRPGQALRLRGTPPVARYSSLVFYDHWFNTPDFDVNRCYLTLGDLELESDGTYEVILGPDDPDHPNWIDTAGLRRGIFSIRCLLPEQRNLPSVELIDLPL